MASRRNTIKTNIEANSEGFIQAMDEVKRSLASTRIEFKNINEIMKTSGNTVSDLTDHKKLLQRELDLTKNRLDVLNKGLEESIRINGEDSEATRIAREEVQKAQTHYLSLKNALKEVNEKLDEQTFSLKNVSDTFGKVSDVAGKFATKVRWLSAGSASLLGLSAKTAIDFEDAFVGVQKTVEGTDAELEKIRKDIMLLSNKIPIATTELFELAEEAGQLGIATKDITNFTETMAKLGSATNLSATEAGEAIATFVNVMGTLPENYERIGSVIVKLGNNSKATESDIMNMAQRMSGAAATLGMTESSVFGLATALSSVGLEAEMGGTAISRVMNDFNRAASGVETKYGTLAQYAEICGMSTKQFADTVKNNAGEALKQFVIGLGDSNRTGKGTIQLLSDLGVNEVRLTDTMLRLANASGTVDEYMKMADEEWIKNTALTTEASKKYADTASQIQIAKNKLGELADKFGQAMLPTINSFLDKAGKVIDWFGNLSEGSKKTITSLLLFTATLWPIAKGVKGITGTAKDITSWIYKFQQSEKAMSAVSSGMSTLGTVGKSVFGVLKTGISSLFSLVAANPWILAITAVIAAIVLLWNKCEWFRNLVTGAFEAIKNFITPIFETIKTTVGEAWNYMIETLQPVLDSLFNMFNSAWELIKTIWDLVAPYFQAIWEGIQQVFSVVAQVLGGFFQVAWSYIKVVWDVAVQYFQLIWTGISAVFSVVKTVIGGAFQVAWAYIKTVWDAVTGYFKAIFDTIAGIFDAVKAVLHGDFSGAWEAIKGVVGTWKDYFANVWNNIKNVFSKVGDFFKNTFSAAWNAIKSVFSGVGSFFSGIWNTIKSVFTGIAQTVGNAMSSVFKSAVNGLIGVAERVLNTPIRAINTAIGILNKVPGVSIGKINEFSLPRMERGGVLEKGARTIIAGENGAEAIVPLENNTKWINRVAEQFKTSFIETMGLNTNYVEQSVGTSYTDEYLDRAVSLLERILDKPSDTYLDGRKISESTAQTDDIASGDLLEKLERGWAT